MNQHVCFFTCNCAGLQRAGGRFWELFPISEGELPVFLLVWSIVSAEASHRKVCGRAVTCAATKQTLKVSRSGIMGTTWMAGFLGFRSWRCQVAQEPPRHQRSRVAARAVSLRGSPMENDLQQSRSVHIFDSLVCAKVVARGRSSSLF